MVNVYEEKRGVAERSFIDIIEKIINLIINHLRESIYETIRRNNFTISQ